MVMGIENTSVVDGPLETTSRYVPGAEFAPVNWALMKLFEDESTVNCTNTPPGAPMKTDGVCPKLEPSIASVGARVSNPLALTFEIVNCGGGVAGPAKAG
jgi:hypothetical protein